MLTTRPTNTAEFSIGDSVDHPQYGRGEIVSAEGTGAARRVGVAFDGDNQPMRMFVVERSPLRHADGPAGYSGRPFPRIFIPA
jgi:hypothetical protein